MLYLNPSSSATIVSSLIATSLLQIMEASSFAFVHGESMVPPPIPMGEKIFLIHLFVEVLDLLSVDTQECIRNSFPPKAQQKIG